jgi:hypothetical protein
MRFDKNADSESKPFGSVSSAEPSMSENALASSSKHKSKEHRKDKSSSKHKSKRDKKDGKSKSKHSSKDKHKERKGKGGDKRGQGVGMDGPFEHRISTMRLSVAPRFAGDLVSGVKETLDGMLMR